MIDETQMTLAMDYDGRDLVGWYWTEKWRGIRVEWDGIGALWTREGNAVKAPAWFTAGFPQFRINCELWAGRHEIETEARLAAQYGIWTANIVLKVIDLPDFKGKWIERMMRYLAYPQIPVIQVPPIKRVETMADVDEAFGAIKTAGGEGMMFRDPNTRGFRAGRNATLLRMK